MPTSNAGYPQIVQDQGLSYDGVGDYLDFGEQHEHCYAAVKNCTNGITMSFWLNYHSTKAGTVLDTGGRSVHLEGFAVLYAVSGSPNKLRINVDDLDNRYLLETPEVEIGA